MYYNKRKLAVSSMWVMIGAVLLILDLTGVISNPIYSGMGAVFLVIGILQIIRNVRYHTDKDYKEKIDIAYQDERNKYIRMKAWAWAGYLFIIGASIVSVILHLSGMKLYGQVVSYCICAILVLFWISYMYLYKTE